MKKISLIVYQKFIIKFMSLLVALTPLSRGRAQTVDLARDLHLHAGFLLAGDGGDPRFEFSEHI